MLAGVVDLVEKHLEEQEREQKQALPVDYIVLTGGLGQCVPLFNRLVERLVLCGKASMVLPPKDEMASVVSGGVFVGRDPSLIRTRIAQLTCIHACNTPKR